MTSAAKPAGIAACIAGRAVAAGSVVLLLAAACAAAGARINTTRSIPVGLYWTSSGPTVRGAYVQFCPPPADVFDEARRRHYIAAGFCRGGYGYLMKRVLAVEGDAVSIGDDGVRVNGGLLPASAPARADKAGRPLPRLQCARFTLGRGEMLPMAEASATSFDGRYFGVVRLSQVSAVITPVVTWPSSGWRPFIGGQET